VLELAFALDEGWDCGSIILSRTHIQSRVLSSSSSLHTGEQYIYAIPVLFPTLLNHKADFAGNKHSRGTRVFGDWLLTPLCNEQGDTELVCNLPDVVAPQPPPNSGAPPDGPRRTVVDSCRVELKIILV